MKTRTVQVDLSASRDSVSNLFRKTDTFNIPQPPTYSLSWQNDYGEGGICEARQDERSHVVRGRIETMLSFLRRWQVTNSLYHIRARRGGVVWIEEHDLIIWITGMDINTHRGPDTLFDKFRTRLAFFFWGVKNHEDLYTKVHNTIHSCMQPKVDWVRSTKSDNGISDSLNLTTRGEEVYAYTYLIGKFFGNHYVKKAFDWIIPAAVIYFLLHYLKIQIVFP